jgi:hypothetical protein
MKLSSFPQQPRSWSQLQHFIFEQGPHIQIHRGTSNMATYKSQMHEEIAPLTDEAKEMEKELASHQTLNHLDSPQSLRWLSLSPYKAVPEKWEWNNDNELGDSFVLPSPALSGSLHSPCCRCQLCYIKQEDGAWGTGSEDSLSPAEKASCRILGVLKCYVYNLEHETLVTGSKVDARVEAALKRWVERGKADVPCKVEHSAEGLVKECREISDEERVVVEIDAYGKGLMEMMGEIPDEILEAANEILEWARMKGTANGRQMDMTSSHDSLEMIEC